MATVLERDVKITGQGQATVPAAVRERLGVAIGDHVTYVIDAMGTVTLRRSATDPAVDAFLEFLAEDIQRQPDQIRPLTGDLEARLHELTRNTRIDRARDCISGDVGL